MMLCPLAERMQALRKDREAHLWALLVCHTLELNCDRTDMSMPYTAEPSN